MDTKNYGVNILVESNPQQVFAAINDVHKWWTDAFEGNAAKVNDVFTVRFGATYITLKVTEFVPHKKMRWQVVDSYKDWLKANKKEWQDTEMLWQLTGQDNGTQLSFTHVGLQPGLECYDGCENAWNSYIKGSLHKLIAEKYGL